MQFQLNMQNTQKSNLDNSQCRPGKRRTAGNNAQILKYLYNRRDRGAWQRESTAERVGGEAAAATKVCNQQFAYLLWQWQKLALFQASLLHLARISHCSFSWRLPLVIPSNRMTLGRIVLFVNNKIFKNYSDRRNIHLSTQQIKWARLLVGPKKYATV